jgi:hypothetical protein
VLLRVRLSAEQVGDAGTVVSRRGIYAKAPPEATREFLNAR